MDDEKIQSLYTAMKEGRSASSKGKGIGIANIYGRLKLSYSTKEPEMRITSQAGKGTVIALTIPNEPGGSFYHEDNTHCG